MGSTLSAFVGMTVRFVVPLHLDLVAAPLAVSVAIGVMLVTRSLHPPGGATAMIAVTGPPQVLASNFWYILFPGFLSSCIFVTMAYVLNNGSRVPSRQYPAFWLPFEIPTLCSSRPYTKLAASVEKTLIASPSPADSIPESPPTLVTSMPADLHRETAV